MKKTNFEVISLDKNADGYIVTIDSMRTPFSEDAFDITIERNSTTANFTCYDTAIKYFYENMFRLETLVNMMEKWEYKQDYSCELKLIAYYLDMTGPDQDDYDCAIFNLDYFKEEE